MRSTLAILALFVAASQDKGDPEAEGLYKAMKEKIAGAKTMRFDFAVTVGEGGRAVAGFRSVVKIKGKDRWTMDVKLEEGPRGRSREKCRPYGCTSAFMPTVPRRSGGTLRRRSASLRRSKAWNSCAFS